MKTYLKFIVCLLFPLVLGGISGIATAAGLGEWYVNLNKPFFNPPSFVFGPVWTLLYVLMGVSLFLISQQPKSEYRKKAIRIFIIQLLLNFFWSFLFFKFQMIGLAFLEILLLWGCLLIMIHRFRMVKPLAAYLQIPYLLWVTFASVLTGTIWWLNH